jgi:hypothetical protein
MIIQANRIVSGYSYSNESMNKNACREQESDKKISKSLGETQVVDMKDNKNPIFMRKNQLKKGAMKIVPDAFAGDQKYGTLNRVSGSFYGILQVTES